MPKGPHGQRRPADVIGNAIMVAKIATGEIVEEARPPRKYAQCAGRKGGPARAKKLTARRRQEIARMAARARWGRAGSVKA